MISCAPSNPDNLSGQPRTTSPKTGRTTSPFRGVVRRPVRAEKSECEVKGTASRIVGQGGILRSLAALVRRVDKFSQHRASTPEEWAWCHRLADQLERAYCTALTPAAQASLDAVDARCATARKTPDV